MSTITRKVYDVFINPDDLDLASDPFSTEGVVCHRVTVTHADQLKGELEAAKRGIDSRLGTTITSVILWSALVRLGLYDRKYESFRDADCADLQSVTPPGEAPEGVPVPPTEEPSGSASPSPTTSPDSSPTGSTPTSTSTS